MIAKLNILGACLIAAVLIYGSTSKSWIYFSYEINKLEIIEKFCVNKEVEEYTCEGKCHLMAQFEEVDQESPYEQESKIASEETTVLFNIVFDYIHIQYSPKTNLLGTFVPSNYTYQPTQDILRPPIA